MNMESGVKNINHQNIHQQEVHSKEEQILLDECGLKGYNIGNAEVSTKHAGFVVNKGNAKAKDILNLVKYISEKVYEKSGKKIELEVQVIGED